ncbi:MAG: hypothetical protein AB7Q91_14315 [Phycisphaerales bacterium]
MWRSSVRRALLGAVLMGGAMGLCACEKHQSIEFGDDILASRGETMKLTRPTAIRITREKRVVSFRIEPYALHGGPLAPAVVALHNSEPEIEVKTGIVFAAGMRPVVKSQRVEAAASGTEFVFVVKEDEQWAVIVTACDHQTGANGPYAVIVRIEGDEKGVNPGQLAKLKNGKIEVKDHPIAPRDGQNGMKVREVLMKEGFRGALPVPTARAE